MNFMLCAYSMIIFGPTNKIRYIGYIILLFYTLYNTLYIKNMQENPYKIEYY